MDELHVDVAVIGTGTAGMTAYRAARAQGARVVAIEAGPYGTTCARVGCMPSKLLIAAADAAHAARHAHGFGVHAGLVTVDGEQVMARVRSERDRFVGFVLESVDSFAPEDKLRGHARFTGPSTLQVGEDKLVHAKAVVIATGSRPVIPGPLRDVGNRVVVNDDVFDWTTLPGSVAVVGTGVIGLEIGQSLHRLGVRTTVFGRSAGIAHMSDPEVQQSAVSIFGSELDLRLESEVVRARQDGGQVELTVRDGHGAEHSHRYDYVLVAAGRMPNVDGIGLEHAGLALDPHGVPLFDARTLQCGTSPVFIAGDANSVRPLLSEAADDGVIAGDNAARYPGVQPGLRRAPLAIAFTDPNLATVGRGYRELMAAGGARFATGQVSFHNQGRSRVMLANRGILRVYGEYVSGNFLGAEMIAPRGEHLAHLLAWAYQMRLTVRQMLEMPFYHPVIEEGVRTALRELQKNIEKGAPQEPLGADSTPGI
ncbi:dihydrolipoyl dehydrogenase [Pseudoduganella sp. GCM10020061]|uniref:dihydrolipoyl dehydrogenase n=1 Tax=Pseudoduganella sp. GCM10020061 TaxID=3317345 RepID=UPI00362A168C